MEGVDACLLRATATSSISGGIDRVAVAEVLAAPLGECRTGSGSDRTIRGQPPPAITCRAVATTAAHGGSGWPGWGCCHHEASVATGGTTS